MSVAHWPWTILEIEPTEDRKAIRETYSRKLKALDHEAETEAYMALRDARDAALSGQFLLPPGDGPVEDDFGLGTPLPEGEGEVPHAQPLTDPEPAEKPVFTVEYSDEDDKRFNRTVELFLGEGELTREESLELRQHLDALLADDRLGDLGHYARVEVWLAQLLADRYPRGADLFPRIAAHFDWGERAHELGIHPAIPWLFNAHEAVKLVRELNTPGHTYHREWIELTRGKPQGMLWTRAVDKSRMANLIATIRRDYAWLEAEHWQPELVARWEKKVAGGTTSGPNPWVWLFLIAIFLAAMLRVTGPESDQSRAAAIEIARTDPDTAIQMFIDREFPQAAADGRTIASLKGQKDGFYLSFLRSVSSFTAASEVVDGALRGSILRDYYMIIDKLPPPFQLQEIGFRLGIIRQIQDDPKRCTYYIRNPRTFPQAAAQADLLSQEYRYHMFAVLHDEYAKISWGPATRRMEISGELMERLGKRSGLPDTRLRAALSDKKTSDADFCTAYTNLYEMLSDIPEADAAKILPGLI